MLPVVVAQGTLQVRSEQRCGIGYLCMCELRCSDWLQGSLHYSIIKFWSIILPGFLAPHACNKCRNVEAAGNHSNFQQRC